MKRTLRNVFSLLFSAIILLNLSVTSITAFASDSEITFKSAKIGFDFQSGSEYTKSDLFRNFKDIMPGDQLQESMQLKNVATDCDYIKVYVRVDVHSEKSNPLSYDEAYENIDGKDQANIDGERDETVDSMLDFLSQLTMRIYNGDTLIYEASPDESGALKENKLLGTLHTGESLMLKAELDVPITLGNEYSNRVGEVDLVFLAECIDFKKLTVHKSWDDNNHLGRPDSVTVHLLRDGKNYKTTELNQDNQWTYTWDNLDDKHKWTVEEDVPLGYEATYQTMDNNIFITNHKYYEESINNPDPVEMSIQKVWSDENNKNGNRPPSVSVTLYNGDTAVENITLSANNNWAYRWKNLDGKGNWSIMETGIPTGYTPCYSYKNGVVTITNTATLIQTGRLFWPILLLGDLGILFLVSGIIMIRKKKNKNA